MDLQSVEKVLSLAGFAGTSPAEKWDAERQKVREFANLGDGWTGQPRSKPPSVEVIEKAIRILDRLQQLWITCPTAVPYSHNEIGLSWGVDQVWLEVAQKDILLSFFADVEE